MDLSQINLNGFEFTFTEQSEWIYKAVPFAKKKGISREKPFIKLVDKLEENYKKEFDKMLASAVKNMTTYLV